MTEKEKYNSKINPFRTINKSEADYNLVLELYQSKITNRIPEKHYILGKNEIGNRRQKSVTDAALVNESIIDTSIINQQPLAIQQNDASACYDRIIANHTSINIRRKGTPKNVCKLRGNVLYSTKIHVQTALDTPKYNYSHKQHPIHGSQQGSGSAGNEWSSIIIPTIKRQGASKDWHSYNPNGDNSLCNYMLGFVDNTKNFVNLSTKG